MNREDIVRMAQETGVTAERVRDLINFANLVASAERRECEKIIWNADAWIGSDAKIWIVKSIQEKRGSHD